MGRRVKRGKNIRYSLDHERLLWKIARQIERECDNAVEAADLVQIAWYKKARYIKTKDLKKAIWDIRNVMLRYVYHQRACRVIRAEEMTKVAAETGNIGKI